MSARSKPTLLEQPDEESERTPTDNFLPEQWDETPNERSDPIIKPSETPTLLEQLRRSPVMDRNWDETARKLIEHQSEFPRTLREVIQRLKEIKLQNVDPQLFCHGIISKLQSLFMLDKDDDRCIDEKARHWDGLDSMVDTEDEVEVAIRIFPNFLSENPILQTVLSLKAYPFVPLLAKLDRELGDSNGLGWNYVKIGGTYICVLHQLCTNAVILRTEPRRDDMFLKHLEELSISVFVRLREEVLISDYCVFHCVEEIFYLNPLWTENKLRCFIRWDPTLLETFAYIPRLDYCHNLERFQTLFELGMLYYPEKIGFLYESPYPKNESNFQRCCNRFDEEAVTRIVEKVLAKITCGRSEATRALLVAAAPHAASKKSNGLDALYFLCRRDPAAFIILDSNNDDYNRGNSPLEDSLRNRSWSDSPEDDEQSNDSESDSSDEEYYSSDDSNSFFSDDSKSSDY